MISARLAGAGIKALYKRDSGSDLPQFGAGGSRDVYVEAEFAQRAREVLSVPEFTDEELSELAERAGADSPSSAS